MKHILLLVSFLLIPLCLHSQKDTVSVVRNYPQKTFVKETSTSNISIYPVPVRENSFTIKADREMTSVKVTNMIGQDIFRAQYSNPVSLTKVLLKKPTRGMYLVTIAFVDGTRVVRKVMIENPE
ncbi:MAG: T9SS type A sorting domain-containing protein [Bacteroidia bacterium]|nr:MAG: T9SS type A sorting domain-containing protein [Bacteroidia bacterium]